MQTQTLNFEFDVKALSSREFEGYGSVFGNVDLGGDVVLPGAFKASLAEHKQAGTLPQMFWMHQPDQVPGKWLAMSEDSTGLYVKGMLADTQLGNDIRELLGIKAVRGLSIGYSIEDRKNDVTYEEQDGEAVRLLRKIKLWEVSPVSLAMNPLATVTAAKARLSKSGEYVPQVHEMKRDVERSLRDAGYSRNAARYVVSLMKFDDDSTGVMPDGRRRDAETVDPVAADLLKISERFTTSMVSEAFRR